MSEGTPTLDELRALVDPRISAVTPLGSGLFSAAYACRIDGQAMVLRLNQYPDDFAKDAFAYAELRGPALPIPHLLRWAPFDATRWYALSERCPGRMLDTMEPAELAQYTPALFAALEAIWQHDTSAWRGWGLTDPSGHGTAESWGAYLLAFGNPKWDYRWSQPDQPPMLEYALIEQGVAAVRALIPLLPTERWLLHGDFGRHNLIGQAGQLTGVLDWAEARLGDWIYDLAYLDFWLAAPYFCREWLAASDSMPPHFWERVRCYALVEAIHTISIAAVRNDPTDYAWGAARLRALLEQPASQLYG